VFGQERADHVFFQRQKSHILIFEFQVEPSFRLLAGGIFEVGAERFQCREDVFHVVIHDVGLGQVREQAPHGFIFEQVFVVSDQTLQHGFHIFGDQTEGEQVFVPESQKVGVQSGGQVFGDVGAIDER